MISDIDMARNKGDLQHEVLRQTFGRLGAVGQHELRYDLYTPQDGADGRQGIFDRMILC